MAYNEAEELQERELMTSSCCPAFVQYIKNNFPEMEKYISTSLSPMAEAGKLIKKYDPDCKVVFIGPCTAKKGEIKDPKVAEYIDYVLTFEELQACLLYTSRCV